VVVEINDNGQGIKAEHLDHIFEPFFTTKPTGQGSGLGLSLSKDIVHTLGGELTVASAEGKGATFRVELPR
jgi:signal transduction histidine kinase